MKNRLVKGILSLLVAGVLLIEGTGISAIASYAMENMQKEEIEEEILEDEESWEDEEEDFIPASSYLYPFVEAVEALNQITSENRLQAVVYLDNVIEMKELPQEDSATVKELPSGEVVWMQSVGQDAYYQIWYQVSYETEMETVTGYVFGENVICVEPAFLEWKDQYIRSMQMFTFLGLGERNTSYPDVEAFPSSYQSMLLTLKQQHPNWVFVKMNTGINWGTLVKNEIGDRSVIWASSSPESWKNGMYDSKWAYASERILMHFLDPRNWLNETQIFQFELLGYSSQYHSVEAVESILSNTFMNSSHKLENGKSYAQTFVDIAKTTNVSPILMAARVRQEQGTAGNSALISGTYPGYEGYYNYYNIGASGRTETEEIISGLETAKAKGWNSRVKALEEGAKFLCGSYINAGQDTLYLQKFDVDNRYHGVFWHQYMQNIQAPSQEAKSVHKAYEKAGLLNKPMVFRIPVYSNMPGVACVKPGEEDQITLSSERIENMMVDTSVVLRPYINGKDATGIEWEFVSSDTQIASVDETGVVKALNPGTVTITCSRKDDKQFTKAGTCTISIIKADVDSNSVKLPELKEITYDPNKALKEITLPEGFAWINPDMIPTVNQSSYGVTYNINHEKYNTITLSIPLTVKKAVPTYTIPTGLQGGATRELGSVSLPNGFQWMNAKETIANSIGKATYMASYNPDESNYETVENIPITISVVCEKHQFTDWAIEEAKCEKDGQRTRNCTICKMTEKEVLPKTGHQYQSEVTKEATEDETGVRTYTCANCQHSYTEEIPKIPVEHVHKYEETVVRKASCTEDGEQLHSCSCGDQFKTVLPAEGHKIENGLCIKCGYTIPVETQKPTTGNQNNGSSETQKPNTGNQSNSSAETTKPDTGNQSNSSTETTKPNTGNQSNSSAETAKPNTGNQSNSSTETTKPDTGNQSNSSAETAKPNTGNQSNSSAETAKPDTGNQSNSSAETTKPDTGNQSNNGTETNKPNNSNAGNESNEPQKPNTGNQSNSSTETGKPANGNQSNSSAETAKPDTGNQNNSATEVKNFTLTAEEALLANLVENAVTEDASKNQKKVSIELNKNTEISRNVIVMAENHGVDMEVSLPNDLTWVIYTETIDKEADFDVNMNAEIVENVIKKEVIDTIVNEQEYMELSLAHEGEFGFEAKLSIPVEEKYQNKTANLFYYNEKTKELEFQMAVPVNEDGTITFSFRHASDYLIVFANHSMEALEESNSMEETQLPTDTDTETVGKQAAMKQVLPVVILIMIIAIAFITTGFMLSQRKQQEPSYFDEDVDDYQEKDRVIPTQKESRDNGAAKETTEYFDDDVDDYRERS